MVGTGLLKPNIGAIVGQLYSAEDRRRDSGYTLYYMGINIGAVIGYTVCGYLQVEFSYHHAFGAAAVGMFIGLVQYKLTLKNLGSVAAAPIQPLSPSAQRNTYAVIVAFLIIVAIITGMAMSGTLIIDPVPVAKSVAVIFCLIFLGYFGAIYFGGNLTPNEKKGMNALFLICIASACFWSGFEQAGSSLNLFGRDYTDRMLGNFEIPTAWFQSANSFFIIILSPFFAALWINLAKRMITLAHSQMCDRFNHYGIRLHRHVLCLSICCCRP